MQIGQQSGSIGIFGRGRQRDRIDDRWVRVGREGRDNPDARFDRGIRRVDDAERRFAASHQKQRGADILGGSDAVRNARPDAEFFQRRLPVHPRGDGGWIGHREPAIAKRRGQGETGRDRQRDRAAGRGDQHQRVTEQIAAASGSYLLALLQIVHPFGVGRDEQIGRRAILDLLCQGRTRGISGRHRFADLAMPFFIDCIECVLQTGRREDDDRPRLGARAACHAERKSGQGLEECSPSHVTLRIPLQVVFRA